MTSYSAAASRLHLTNSLNYQFPFHSWTLLCKRLHLVTLDIFRRGSEKVFTRYPHFISGCFRSKNRTQDLVSARFLHRWVLARVPRFLLMCLFKLPYEVQCYTMLPNIYRSRSSLLDVSSRTIFWTAKNLIVSPHHRYKTILVVSDNF